MTQKIMIQLGSIVLGLKFGFDPFLLQLCSILDLSLKLNVYPSIYWIADQPCVFPEAQACITTASQKKKLACVLFFQSPARELKMVL